MKVEAQNAAIANEADWSLGLDSYTHYCKIGRGNYCWAVNVVNRGGMVQTRPGKKHIFSLPMTGIPQGLCLFRPTASFGNEVLVWAIGGTIYMSRYPFTSYQIVTGLKFDPGALMVRFCAGKKVTQLNPDGTLTILPVPYNVLIIQDGATAAGVMDGGNATGYHIYGGAPTYGTPLGLHMCWSGNRLWVARDETVYVSDFLDPLTFSDSRYLATADGFKLPWPCNGMIESPDERTLLAFCQSAIVSFQSSIADRTMWQQVTDFQKIIVPETGSIAPRSIINQFGTTWFYSEFGLTNIDMARSAAGTDRIPPKDIEMIRSKDNLSADKSGMCGTSFETFALMSVPSGSLDNRHTWVFDAAPQSRLNQTSDFSGSTSWASVWTGTYPIEYASGIVQGESRCFELAKSCAAMDKAHVHIWENFVGQRYDNTDTPIACSVELRCFDFGTDRYKFKFLEVDLAEIYGEVNFEIWYAGIKGNFQRIGQKTIEAEIGIFGPDLEITYDADPLRDTLLRSYRPQTRTIRSEEVSGSRSESPDGTDDGLCTPESVYAQNVDKGFQFLLRWTGSCALRQVRLYADPYMEPGIGTCEDSEEGEVNVLDEIGTLPPPGLCIESVPVVVTPSYLLQTTGTPVVGGQYELYHMVTGTPDSPGSIVLLHTWYVNVDVLAGFLIDYSPQLTQFSGSGTFLWIYRYGTGTAISPVLSPVTINPASGLQTGIAKTASQLGIDTFYFTVSNVDATQYKAIHQFSGPPVSAPLYLIDTAHYRDDSYSDVNDPTNYKGVIAYPGLGFDVFQLQSVYQPGTHIPVSQQMVLVGSYVEGKNFKLGDQVDITNILDVTQFPFLFSVLRKGTPAAGYSSDLWAYAGAANMQIGIVSASATANVVRMLPPVLLPGTWGVMPSAQSIQVNNAQITQMEMALSPNASQKTLIGFYWPGWDYGIPPTDAFFSGPCGIEIWDPSNNVLQRFTYQTDFGPDILPSVNQPNRIDLTALCQAHTSIKIVRFSYFGTGTKKVYIDADPSNGAGSFELGEASVIGARYPTDAVIAASGTLPGASAPHNLTLNTAFSSYLYAFVVMNISNQPRYA